MYGGHGDTAPGRAGRDWAGPARESATATGSGFGRLAAGVFGGAGVDVGLVFLVFAPVLRAGREGCVQCD